MSPQALLDVVTRPLVARRRSRRMARLYSRFLDPGDLCFDVGANLGGRVEAFRALGARVVAIEPDPACHAALRRRFGADPGVTVLGVGLAESEGRRPLWAAGASTLSSMSEEWIETVRRSGRFSEFSWDAAVEVPVTTLEAAIADLGRPRFCKIDVEGYEARVLEGLRTPVEALSFEYAHEARESAFACMERLGRLGEYEFCFSPAETMDLCGGWRPLEEQRAALERLTDPLAWGDVYARALS